jgi:hypothetical protein
LAYAVIVVLYASIGVLAAVGSVTIGRKYFSTRGEQAFYALFLIPIAGFYLAFTAYFGRPEAWTLELGAVLFFSAFGLAGVRFPLALALGYLLHGLWDLGHELQASWLAELAGGAERLTEVPMAYGVFCVAFDVALAWYAMRRRGDWNAVWTATGVPRAATAGTTRPRE